MQTNSDRIHIINMLHDYTQMYMDAKTTGAFEAFRRYTHRYAGVFDGMLKYLYMASLEKLRPIIEKTDFDLLLATAAANCKNGSVGLIQSAAELAASQLGFFERFDLYLGMGLGHIGGYAGPAESGTPSIYVGIDTELTECRIHMLIPHEINHMARFCALPGLSMFGVLERTVSEGLASMCPIVLNRMPYGPATLAQTLGVPVEAAHALTRRSDALVNMVSKEFGQELNAERFAKYFAWAGSRPQLAGYFAGMVIIHELMERGYSIRRLTVMPSEEIWREYQRETQ